MRYDVAVIGGGPGGYTAALYCARAGLTAVVLEMLSPGGQMATTEKVDNYPGFENGVDGFELGEKMKAGAERFGVKTEFAQVTALELSAAPKLVHTTSGELEADVVIIATGAAPRHMGLDGEEELRGRGVSYCATCDGNFFRGKTVAICGGGNSAAADALTLSKLCQKVYLVHRRDALRASGSYHELLKKAGNIEFVFNAQAKRVLHEAKVTGLEYLDKNSGELRSIACDGIFIAAGRIPVSELVRGQLELDDNGYITADETTRTNIPGVFAVGDVRTKPLRQIVTAASDGAVASMFAEEYLSSR